jgi:hypothetical protein
MQMSWIDNALVTLNVIFLVGGCSVDLNKLRVPILKDAGPSRDLALETGDGTGKNPDLGPNLIGPTDVGAPTDGVWSPNDAKGTGAYDGVQRPESDGPTAREVAGSNDLRDDGSGAGGSFDGGTAVTDTPFPSDVDGARGTDDVATADTDGTNTDVPVDLPLTVTGGAGGSSRDGSWDVAADSRGGSTAGSGGTDGSSTSKDGTVGSGGSGTGGSTSADAASVCIGYVGSDAGAGLTQGLVAYYPCESASGVLLPDQSGNGKDATLVTGTLGRSGYSFGAGKVNKALYLAVANQGYVTLPTGLLATACEATVATWVYVNSSVGWQRIFDFGKDTNVYMFLTPLNLTTNVIRFAISVGGNSSDHEQSMDGQAALTPGVWKHVAVVLGPSGGILYVNGAQVGANAAMTLRPADLGNTQNSWIGRSQFSWDPTFDGNIDELRIYDRALSPAEIQALASGT